MAEQAVLQVHRMRRVLSRSSVAVVHSGTWRLGPPLFLGLLAALVALQLEGQAWRSKAEVVLRVQPGGAEYLQEQAELARSRELASRVVVKAGVPGMTTERFLRHSSALPPSDADTPGLACIDPCPELATDESLTLSVSDRRSAAAVRLTNTYAAEFARLRRKLGDRQIGKALASIHRKMMALRARGQTKTPRYRNLAQLEREVPATLRQFGSNAATRPAEGAGSFRPHPFRNGLLGVGIGALVGIALVVGMTIRSRRTD